MRSMRREKWIRGIEGTVRSRGLRPLVTAGLAVVAVIGGGAAARAEEPPAFSVVFPAGLACPAFDLRVDGFGDGPEVFRTFSDRDGNIVRALTAGTGFALVFTNETTGETFSSRANGAVAHTRFNPDGSQTQVLTGHNIVILFPTDTPPGLDDPARRARGHRHRLVRYVQCATTERDSRRRMCRTRRLS